MITRNPPLVTRNPANVIHHLSSVIRLTALPSPQRASNKSWMGCVNWPFAPFTHTNVNDLAGVFLVRKQLLVFFSQYN